jgi:hypothetical protein
VGSTYGNGVGSDIRSGGTGVGTRAYVPGRSRVGSDGSRYSGSVSLGVRCRNPGGGARGPLSVFVTLGVAGTDGSLAPEPSGTPSSSEEEREPWIGSKRVPGGMTVGTGSDVGVG